MTQGFLKRFAACLAFLPEELKLLVVVGTDARHRLFTRLLHHPNLQKVLPDMPKAPRPAAKLYRVQRVVPVIHSLVSDNRDLRELRALGLGRLGQSYSSLQLAPPVEDDTNHDGRDFWSEEEHESCELKEGALAEMIDHRDAQASSAAQENKVLPEVRLA